MLLALLIALFVLGYVCIILEHPLRLDKTVASLLMAGACWAVVAVGHIEVLQLDHTTAPLGDVLLQHTGKAAEVLIFLIGAMTIVELVDLHHGFDVITNRVTASQKKQLLVWIGVLSFCLSAILDNLASTIVLVSLLRRLVPHREERIWFVAIAVIGANSGGAWSPIGDLTTTMLWIGNKVTTLELIKHVFLPSVVSLAVPVFLASRMQAFQGDVKLAERDVEQLIKQEKPIGARTMLAAGVGGLLFVPLFKTFTGLPPYLGMMVALGLVWLTSEIIHRDEAFDRKEMYTANHALSRIEMSSVLFFLGVLLAVGALESAVAGGEPGHPLGVLGVVAQSLNAAIPNKDAVVIVLGGISAVIDNVPLVAASMAMYTEPPDARLWHFIAYAAGTGGSMLIIGSAAGVAAMGMEKIDFLWFFRKVSPLALAGFLAGTVTFILFS